MFFVKPEEIGIILKSRTEASLFHRSICPNHIIYGGQSSKNHIVPHSDTHLFPKQMGKVVFIHEKCVCDVIKMYFLSEILVNVGNNFVNQRIGNAL